MMQFRSTAATILILAAGVAPAAAADVKSRLQDTWRADIAKTPAPAEGCYTAEYPSKTWKQVQCAKAPPRPTILRRPSGSVSPQTVGGGNDVTAVGNGVVQSATGIFATVKGLKTEVDGQANIYSLQLNSDFFTTSVCNGASNPSQCKGWEQFL